MKRILKQRKEWRIECTVNKGAKKLFKVSKIWKDIKLPKEMLAWPSFHDALDLPLFAWRSQPATELRQSKAWNVIDHDTGLNPANKTIIQRAIWKK